MFHVPIDRVLNEHASPACAPALRCVGDFLFGAAFISACTTNPDAITDGRSLAIGVPTAPTASMERRADPVIDEGRRIFRDDTLGDEKFWTDTLKMNGVVETAVDPTTALKVGLKVDADVLPPGILQTVDLTSPATTVALLKSRIWWNTSRPLSTDTRMRAKPD